MSDIKDKHPHDIYRFVDRPLSDNSGPMQPKTLDESSRSVEIVITTDKPINEYDYRTDQVLPTVIVPEGVELPENRQVPLLDCHDRSSTVNQIGSIRDMRVEDNGLVGKAFYASDEKSDRVYTLVKEGHLTDYSIGASIREVEYLEEDETKDYFGRTYSGPAKIITKSRIMEVSSCPIGADSNAKNRSKTTEGHNMPEEVKKEAPVEAPVERTPEVQPEINVEDVQRQAIEAERSRLAEVESLCRDLGMDEKFQDEVKDLKVEEVKDRALKVIAEKNKEINVSSPVVSVADAADKYRAGIEDAFALRAGILSTEASAERKSIAREMAGYTMLEVCRKMLEHKGQSSRGDQREVVSRAISTSDFPLVLGNIGHKSLLESFDAAQESYESWVDTSGSLSNFHIHTKVRSGELTTGLTEIKEGEGIQYRSRSEQSETVQLATYAEGFKLTRQAIINDDLSQLTDAMEEMGADVKLLYGDLVYAVLTANAAMGDGTALFHADHGNLGTAGAVSETTIGEMIKLMKLQKDIGGRKRLNIRPQFILAPVALEQAIETFFSSDMFVNSDAAATRNNIYSGRYNRVYEPRLDDDSATAWYAAAANKTVKMSFLNGNSSPYMEREKEFETDCIKWKVRTDAVAKAVRWEGLFKNAGA